MLKLFYNINAEINRAERTGARLLWTQRSRRDVSNADGKTNFEPRSIEKSDPLRERKKPTHGQTYAHRRVHAFEWSRHMASAERVGSWCTLYTVHHILLCGCERIQLHNFKWTRRWKPAFVKSYMHRPGE